MAPEFAVLVLHACFLMTHALSPTIWSIAPPVVAVTLAFVMRDATVALLLACVAGLYVAGEGISGLPGLLTRSLATPDFIWVLLIEVCIGMLIAFFMASGATQRFAEIARRRVSTPQQVQTMGWCMSSLIFFSDYFSPLLTGQILRPLADQARVSREKLAYLCDSMAGPVCILVPLSSWGVFVSGLLVGHGPVKDNAAGMALFMSTIPMNFYALGTVLMVLLIALGVVPDFGGMGRAERRARVEGKLLADGARPVLSTELAEMRTADRVHSTNLWLNFFLPIALTVGIAMGSFILTGRSMVLEGFMAAVLVQALSLRVQGVPLAEIVTIATQGVKGIVPAVILVALAYSISTVTKELGTAAFIVEATRGWLTAAWLPAAIFLLAGVISFATGTSWGTYAILFPVALPLAYQFSGGQITPTVLATIGAVASGGCFGDHCSPLSDTTVLASFGAGSDHMDHVKTQMTYALVVAAIAFTLHILFSL